MTESYYPSSNERPSFPLLRLPPELWTRIARFAVQASSQEIYLPERGDNVRPLAAAVQQPAITRTCRLLRQECLQHFYRFNTFVYRDHGTTGEPLLRWLGHVRCCDWAQSCNVVVETRFPNALGFFRQRLSTRCLPFKCTFREVVSAVEDDGQVIEFSRYGIELCDEELDEDAK